MNSTRKPRLWQRLGPGLITGAADDDPSGIATYSQVGAQFGYGMAWTMLFSLPLMIAIQQISARIGCVTGRGIADNLRRHYGNALVRAIVLVLLVANIINLGADLGAMGAALKLLLGGNQHLYTMLFAIACVAAEIFIPYRRYARVLKWLTVSLFAYVAVVFAVHLPWRQALFATFVPHLALNATSAMALVAVLGTTISPYLFFWQAALEVEERRRHGRLSFCLSAEQARPQFQRIRTDTIFGMTISNLIAIFIIFATAATLHAAGSRIFKRPRRPPKPSVPSPASSPSPSSPRASSDRPVRVPVLAGSAAYALSEAFQWKEGLDRGLLHARLFYGAIAIATMMGVALNFTRLDPVKALYWAAVVNGVLAAPVMAVVMLIASNPKIMGPLVLDRTMKAIGWLATAVMLIASIAFFVLGA